MSLHQQPRPRATETDANNSASTPHQLPLDDCDLFGDSGVYTGYRSQPTETAPPLELSKTYYEDSSQGQQLRNVMAHGTDLSDTYWVPKGGTYKDALWVPAILLSNDVRLIARVVNGLAFDETTSFHPHNTISGEIYQKLRGLSRKFTAADQARSRDLRGCVSASVPVNWKRELHNATEVLGAEASRYYRTPQAQSISLEKQPAENKTKVATPAVEQLQETRLWPTKQEIIENIQLNAPQSPLPFSDLPPISPPKPLNQTPAISSGELVDKQVVPEGPPSLLHKLCRKVKEAAGGVKKLFTNVTKASTQSQNSQTSLFHLTPKGAAPAPRSQATLAETQTERAKAFVALKEALREEIVSTGNISRDTQKKTFFLLSNSRRCETLNFLAEVFDPETTAPYGYFALKGQSSETKHLPEQGNPGGEGALTSNHTSSETVAFLESLHDQFTGFSREMSSQKTINSAESTASLTDNGQPKQERWISRFVAAPLKTLRASLPWAIPALSISESQPLTTTAAANETLPTLPTSFETHNDHILFEEALLDDTELETLISSYLTSVTADNSLQKGAFLNLDNAGDKEIVVVGRLAGRYDYLEAILNESDPETGRTVYQKIQSDEAVLVLLGGMLFEERAGLLGAMESSVVTLQNVLKLKQLHPESVYLFASEEELGITQRSMKEQHSAFNETLEKLYGDNQKALRALKETVLQQSLCVSGSAGAIAFSPCSPLTTLDRSEAERLTTPLPRWNLLGRQKRSNKIRSATSREYALSTSNDLTFTERDIERSLQALITPDSHCFDKLGAHSSGIYAEAITTFPSEVNAPLLVTGHRSSSTRSLGKSVFSNIGEEHGRAMGHLTIEAAQKPGYLRITQTEIKEMAVQNIFGVELAV